MRVALLLTATVVGALFANPSHAGSLDASAGAAQALPPGFQSYRGYMFDLTENSERKDVDKLTDNLKQQIDVVEASGLSPRVLRFFHTVPIVASELACLDEGAATACYGRVTPDIQRTAPRTLTVWDPDKQRWTNPNAVDLAVDFGPRRDHAAAGHDALREGSRAAARAAARLSRAAVAGRLRQQGRDRLLRLAKSKDLLPKESYAMKNPMEFFAVTASIFLAGKSEFHDPKSREALKEKMPDYYKYLVGVFGFDPDPAAASGPVASLK